MLKAKSDGKLARPPKRGRRWTSFVADDSFPGRQARGLHEGYLVTPITKLELVAGFNISGTIKAVLAGISIAIIGSLIAGIPSPLDPMRLFRLTVVIVVTAFALISLMFLIMVRVTDPLLPRAIFGVLNTLLYFPSGAVYPPQGFPGWMQVIAAVDPFTYAVHAFKSLLLKNTNRYECRSQNGKNH